MTTSTNQPSFIVRVLKVILRLVLVLLIGILIGAGIYFGVQFAYQQLVIPTRENASELQNLETRVSQQWELLQEKNKALEVRLSQVEIDIDNSEDQLSEITADLTQLAADLDAFQIQQDDVGAQIEEIESAILGLIDQSNDLAKQNEDLQETVQELDVEAKLQPIYQELQIFKLLLQVNRSRLYLIQDNYGLAKQELEFANQLLNTIILNAEDDQKDEMLLWDARLKLAISHLPDNPILANDDLEILWTMMIDVMKSDNSESNAEMSEDISATATPKP